MSYDTKKFAEKYKLAVQSVQKDAPNSGLCGVELEWNLLDSHFRPLLTVGAGPSEQSFVDYLREDILTPWSNSFSQLEVFHWMIEWATRPYFSPRGAVYEARLMEGLLINALEKVGRSYGEQLYSWHGNLLYNPHVSHSSIPGSWDIAKRRYLERCVDLYGDTLATAGTHANLSIPEPLLAWEFMHLAGSERGDMQFDRFKSEFYIKATRLFRGFTALFIATGASTPLRSNSSLDEHVVEVTAVDSIRNLTFPNPPEIDIPDLYRSYDSYLQLSNGLVRQGIRFGNNNWTPVRARSFAEPVEKLIEVTSEQLNDLYARGLYTLGQTLSVEDMASEIERQNLIARIHLPMSRVEIRTDDGGLPLDQEIANLTLKHLLLLHFFAEKDFASSFHYDAEDIHRARLNEAATARDGLRAVIEHPFNGGPIGMREYLKWTLSELKPLASELGLWGELQPLSVMADGAPNTAELIREQLCRETKDRCQIPVEELQRLAQQRVIQLNSDVEYIAADFKNLKLDRRIIGEFLQHARDEVHNDPLAPIRFRRSFATSVQQYHQDKTSEILALSQELIRIPSVTASPNERISEVRRAATWIYDFAREYGMGVRYYDQEKYPALLIGFPGQMHAPVMLAGHFDVVEPDPDDSQFIPRIEGDYLWGRGAADMKTVLGTLLIWMKDIFKLGDPYPPINLLLIGNEENGEAEAMGTPQLLNLLLEDTGYQPELLIAGERTGENGDERYGQICTENRGVMRFEIVVRGTRMPLDISTRLIDARNGVSDILSRYLTLEGSDGWNSQISYPYVQVGSPGIFNISADRGVIGIEVRPIPQNDIVGLVAELRDYCSALGLELEILVQEAGIICDPDNPYLLALTRAVGDVSGGQPVIGRKLPGTSARFAPRGQGVVWGQSGIAPHSAHERHYIPSIEPYYQVLTHYSESLITRSR